jgi:hypothetical protein
MAENLLAKLELIARREQGGSVARAVRRA